jgi:hypothetical protein
MTDTSAPLDRADVPRPTGPWEYADAEEGYEYMVSMETNKMVYYDDAGTKHEIHLPTGRSREARDHVVNERWEELAKFPKWGKAPPCLPNLTREYEDGLLTASLGYPDNQKYTDEDYTITKYKKNPTTDEESEGVVVKEQGKPLVKTDDGKVILHGRDGGSGK